MMAEVNDDNYEIDDMQSLHGLLLLMKPLFQESIKKNPKINLPEDFYAKRKIGENDTYICELIRNDSIEKFIVYVNKESISLDDEFESSIYETNSLLMECGSTSLIEYAAFFGSIQVFKYLFKNGIELYPSLWTFAVHGQNPELISYLEDNGLKFHFKSMFIRNTESDSYDEEEEEGNIKQKKNDEGEEKESSIDYQDINGKYQNSDNNNEKESDVGDDDNEDKNDKRNSLIIENSDGDDNDNDEEETYSNVESYLDTYDEFSNNENQEESDDGLDDFKNSRESVLREAIKCHHNDIAYYIINNYIKDDIIDYNNINKYGKSVNAYSFQFYNLQFLPKKFTQKFIIFYACQYGYYEIVKNLLKNKKIKLVIEVI